MAEKTLYVDEAVAEDDPAEVEVCAIGLMTSRNRQILYFSVCRPQRKVNN
jgi:hypothetical protein